MRDLANRPNCQPTLPVTPDSTRSDGRPSGLGPHGGISRVDPAWESCEFGYIPSVMGEKTAELLAIMTDIA